MASVEEMQAGARNFLVQDMRVGNGNDAVAGAVHNQRGASDCGQFVIGNQHATVRDQGLLCLDIEGGQTAPVRLAVKLSELALPVLGERAFEQPVADSGGILLVDGWLCAQCSNRLDAHGMERSQQEADNRAIAEAHDEYLRETQVIEQRDQVFYIL